MYHSNARVPGAGEKAVSACVLAVLAAVVVWLFLQQRNFDPAVTAATMGGPAAAAKAPQDLLRSWPEGISSMGAPEAFTPTSLSDKIDGKADLYLSAGFLSLASQRLKVAVGSAAWLEMFVFDMGSPSNAYSVFSSQRRPGAADAGVADYSYQAENELCLVLGRYYVELVGSERSEQVMHAAQSVAQAYAGATKVAEHADVGAEKALFPQVGLIADSIALVPSDVFGFDGLRDVFVARYREGTSELTLFAARRPSEADSAKASRDLLAFFVDDCGGKADEAPSGAGIVALEGRFEAVAAVGPYLVGVHQAPDRETALRWLGIIRSRVSGQHP
jgi:hypothetical protein